jgi:WD40 repeat protein
MLEYSQEGKAVPSTRTQLKRSCKRLTTNWFSLILSFSLVFSVVYWFSSVQPYATLNIGEDGHFMRFSPDCKSLITAGKDDLGRKAGALRGWDVERGIERFSVAGKWKKIETVHFSPDSGLFAAHEQEGDLTLWSTTNGREIAKLETQTRFGNWVNFGFSPDGRALVFQDFNKEKEFGEDCLTFWSIEDRKELGSIRSYFWTLAFGPEGRSFATFTRKEHGRVDRIMLWSWERSQSPVLVHEYSISTHEVAFSPDLSMFATAEDDEVILWDMATGAKRSSARFDGKGTHLQSLSFEANGNILVAHGGGGSQLDWHWRTTVWDVAAGLNEIGSFSETPVVSPDGKWLAIPLDEGVSLFHSSQKEEA